MREEILADMHAVARRGAEVIASAAREAVAARGRFVLAISGGTTPWLMLRHLADLHVPWPAVELFQTDERIAPAGHIERNLTHLTHALLDQAPEPLAAVHAMPVEMPDHADAARRYADSIRAVAGDPPVFDLVHLGLGEDGHTASLVPNDPVLDEVATAVAVTGDYGGRRRMTITYPVLTHARRILWVVTGAGKAPMLNRLRAGDQTIPAGRVRSDRALLLADRAAGDLAHP
jgi:6-phosphogluconolactonase